MFATEAEGKLSSRPLIYIDENIRSANAITPNHFLTPGKPVRQGLPRFQRQRLHNISRDITENLEKRTISFGSTLGNIV